MVQAYDALMASGNGMFGLGLPMGHDRSKIALLACLLSAVGAVGAPLWTAEAEHLAAVKAAVKSSAPALCQGCDLRGVNLSANDLQDADFSHADLANADLSGANLRGADLSGSSMIGANLISTDLTDADLTGANLSRAFIRATRFCGTTMPDGRVDDSGC